MSTKVKALLWEELRVGGSIAGVCGLVGLILQVSFRLSFDTQWHSVQRTMLGVTFGLPLTAAMLLTFNTANSGHLSGGFSKRILRLPVATHSTVLLLLAARVAMVLVTAMFLFAGCWLLFQDGPPARVVFLIAGTYLFMQTLDWARQVAAPLVPLAVSLVLALLLYRVGDPLDWKDALLSDTGITLPFLLYFAGFSAVTSVVSLLLVKRTRCGEPLPLSGLFTRESLAALTTVPVLERRKPFASPLAAQTWFELRRNGASFPLTLLAAWLFVNGVRWLVLYADAAGSNQRVQELDWLNPRWTFEILPLAALGAASFAWMLRTASRDKRAKGHPGIFARRQPLTGDQMARARLMAAGFNLAPVMAVLTAVYVASFLLSDGGLAARFMAEALEYGESSRRELAAILLGPPLLAGLAAWVIMNLGNWTPSVAGGVAWTVAGTGVTLLYCLLMIGGAHDLQNLLLILAVWSAMLFPSLLLAGRMIRTQRAGIVPGRAVLTGVVAWATLTIGLYPFSAQHELAWPLALFLSSLALGALLVLPYFSATMGLSRHQPRGPFPAENPAQHRRTIQRGNRAARALGVAVLFAAAAMLAWLHGPGEPVWKKSWRAQGLPTDLQEVDARYEQVPPEQNLAVRLLDASDKAERLEQDWREALPEAKNLSPEEKECRTGVPNEVASNLAIVGCADIGLGEPIPPKVWRWTKHYYDEVAAEVCLNLHAASRAGLTKSRYHADLREVPYMELDYLSKLRQLARLLAVEAWVASVENRSDLVADAVPDILLVGDSMKDSPILIDQLVRIAIHGIAYANLEEAMSRVSFSGEELERIQEELSRPLGPGKQAMLTKAIIGEGVRCLSFSDAFLPGYGGLDHTYREASSHGQPAPWWWQSAANALAPLADIGGFGKFENLINVRFFAEMRQRSQDILQGADLSTMAELEDQLGEGIWHRAILASIIMPGQIRAYQYEWLCRTRRDAARTAVAIERFRLDRNRLPQHLNELTPAYLDILPRDFWNHGQSLSYRVKENGAFVVYSYGLDREDDRGEIDPERNWWHEGDVTFTVAAPEVRNRPQVAGL